MEVYAILLRPILNHSMLTYAGKPEVTEGLYTKRTVKEVTSRKEQSVIFMQNDKNNIMLVSYIYKKKSGKKCYRSV